MIKKEIFETFMGIAAISIGLLLWYISILITNMNAYLVILGAAGIGMGCLVIYTGASLIFGLKKVNGDE